MNSWFHFVTLYRRHHAAFSKRDMIGACVRDRQVYRSSW
jgi:hypothetical protein